MPDYFKIPFGSADLTIEDVYRAWKYACAQDTLGSRYLLNDHRVSGVYNLWIALKGIGVVKTRLTTIFTENEAHLLVLCPNKESSDGFYLRDWQVAKFLSCYNGKS